MNPNTTQHLPSITIRRLVVRLPAAAVNSAFQQDTEPHHDAKVSRRIKAFTQQIQRNLPPDFDFIKMLISLNCGPAACRTNSDGLALPTVGRSAMTQHTVIADVNRRRSDSWMSGSRVRPTDRHNGKRKKHTHTHTHTELCCSQVSDRKCSFMLAGCHCVMTEFTACCLFVQQHADRTHTHTHTHTH